FWCSRAFGVQRPAVRRLWPKRYRRSDVYRRLVAFDRRHQLSARVSRMRGQPQQEPVVQDVEIPITQTGKFLDVFHRDVGISPVSLCPWRFRADPACPWYPLEPGELYVTVVFWPTAPLQPGQPDDYTTGWWRTPSVPWVGTSRCTPPCTTHRRSSGAA